MGSDEKLVSSAIDTISDSASHSPDLIIGNPVTSGVERKFLRMRGAQAFRFDKTADFAHYLDNCQEISAAFAFMSTIIVRKAFWLAAPSTEWEFLHPYTHMLQICRSISIRPTYLRYVDKPLVETGHNVNEFNRTLLPHFELDLLTIEYITTNIFHEKSPLFEKYGYIFKLQYTSIEILKARVESAPDRWNKLLPSLRKFGYSKYLLRKVFCDRLILLLYYFFKRLNALLRSV